MDELTRKDARARVAVLLDSLVQTQTDLDNGRVEVVLETISRLKDSLDDLAIFLLIWNMRERMNEKINDAESPSPEAIVEEARATLARFFNLL